MKIIVLIISHVYATHEVYGFIICYFVSVIFDVSTMFLFILFPCFIDMIEYHPKK